MRQRKGNGRRKGCGFGWACTAILAEMVFLAGMMGVRAAAEEAKVLQEPPKPKADKETDSLVLANEAIEFHFRVEGGQVRLVRIENKLAGQSLPIVAETFLIGLEGQSGLGPTDFVFQKADRQPLPAGGQRLWFHHTGKKPGQTLDIVYELGQTDFFVRRRLELRTLPGADGLAGDHANWAEAQLLRE